MRETAIMDFVRTEEGGPAWAPTAEKVLGLDELHPSGGRPSEGPPPGAQPAGVGPRSGLEAANRRGSADLESLGDLTYAELARAQGLDPEAVDRLTTLRLPRPVRPGQSSPTGQGSVSGPVPPSGSARPPAPGPGVAADQIPARAPSPPPRADQVPAAAPASSPRQVVPAVPADKMKVAPAGAGAMPAAATRRRPSEMAGEEGDRYSPTIGDPRPRPSGGAAQVLMTPLRPAPTPEPTSPSAIELPTWPPLGTAVGTESEQSSRPRGSVASRHRPSRRSARWPAVAILLVVAVAAAGAWSLLDRTGKSVSPVAWDPRATAAAGFVAGQTHMAWRHPVAVTFLGTQAFSARFAKEPAGGLQPAATDQARWLPSAATVYVNGTAPTLYTQLGLVGQLTEALAEQNSPSRPPSALVQAAIQVQVAYERSLNPLQAAVLRAEERSAG